MKLIMIAFMSIPVTLIFSIMAAYDIHDLKRCRGNKKKCRDCKYYMSEVETRTEKGAFSLCSERYISVMSTDICEKYRK